MVEFLVQITISDCDPVLNTLRSDHTDLSWGGGHRISPSLYSSNYVVDNVERKEIVQSDCSRQKGVDTRSAGFLGSGLDIVSTVTKIFRKKHFF